MMNNERQIDSLVNKVLIAIMAVEVLLSSNLGVSISSNINVMIVTALFFLIYIIYCFLDGIKDHDFMYMIFLLILILFFKNSSIVFLSSLALLSSRLNINNYIYIYKCAIGIGLVLTALLALTGKLPMHNYIDGVISLGVTNENTLGFYLSFFAILCTLKVTEGKLVYNFSILNIIFLVLVMLFDVLIITYNTAVILISIYLLFVVFNKTLTRVKLFLLLTSSFIPPLLAILSYWSANNFERYGLLQRINELLSNRFLMWHYYVVNFQWGIKGSSWKISDGIYQGYLDGAYFSELLFFGVLGVILILGLSFINVRLILAKEWILFSLILMLEICGFAENVLFNYSDSFGVAFALLGFYPGKINGLSCSSSFKLKSKFMRGI